MTTETQIQAMRAFADALKADPLVSEAIVDDWGRYGNFQIIVHPSEPDRYSTVRLKALLTRLLPSGAHLRATHPAQRTADYRGRISYQSGWMFDVDYQVYDPDSNTFLESEETRTEAELRTLLGAEVVQLGWILCEQPCAAIAEKTFATGCGPKVAFMYATKIDDEVLLTAHYMSEGRNILSTVYGHLPLCSTQRQLTTEISRAAADIENYVSNSYAVRLLK